ncbi:MAG TPA: hypothetical protein VMD05_08210 [Candidatus Nanoarchaeia archaeon]|nr:hypothetical protein [Candidatus Nanoarchaeia archaeon]
MLEPVAFKKLESSSKDEKVFIAEIAGSGEDTGCGDGPGVFINDGLGVLEFTVEGLGVFDTLGNTGETPGVVP